MFKPTVFSLSTYSALFPVLFVCISQVFLSTSILCGDLNAKVDVFVFAVVLMLPFWGVHVFLSFLNYRTKYSTIPEWIHYIEL